MPLTPQQRSLRARIGAHALHAKYDSAVVTEKARAASPGSLNYWEARVDPDGVLDPKERARRAGHLKKSYFTALALKSARARQRRRPLD